LTLATTADDQRTCVDKSRVCVIVMRGWLDGEDIRVRILVAGGEGRQWIVLGSQRAAELVEGLLEQIKQADESKD
jgi:hypothetical protein